MLRFIVFCTYAASGISMGCLADDWNLKCHGRHLSGTESQKMIGFALTGVPITIAASILSAIAPSKPVCETGHTE